MSSTNQSAQKAQEASRQQSTKQREGEAGSLTHKPTNEQQQQQQEQLMEQQRQALATRGIHSLNALARAMRAPMASKGPPPEFNEDIWKGGGGKDRVEREHSVSPKTRVEEVKKEKK